jgi:hypothetical protein
VAGPHGATSSSLASLGAKQHLFAVASSLRLIVTSAVAMVALSLAGIQSSFGIKAAPITMWAHGLLTVTLISFKYFRDDRIRFVQASGSFFIPGSWTPFLVIMAIFFTKYVFAVMRASNAEMVSTSTFVATLSLAYGCFSGYFCSRVLNLVTKSKDTQTLTGRSTR